MRPFIAVVCLLAPIQLAASEPGHVEVRLVDGRHVVGIVDQKTDAQTLWLRSTDAGIVLTSGHSWKAIASVQHRDSLYSGESMINTALAMRTSFELPLNQAASELQRHPRVSTTTVLRNSPPSRHNNDLQIRTLRADAVHSNWDRDAETDGLRVVITPLNNNRDTVAHNAIVEVELIGEHFSPTRSPHRFQRLGRWTREVKAHQFSVDGVTLNLPYQKFRPSRDQDVLNDGLVQVRFKIPGVGSYEATDPWVRLRPASPFLNRYQLHTGHQTRIFGQHLNPTRVRSIQRY